MNAEPVPGPPTDFLLVAVNKRLRICRSVGAGPQICGHTAAAALFYRLNGDVNRSGHNAAGRRRFARLNTALTAARGRGPMPTYKAPVDDALFLLNDVFHFDRYGNLPGFADASPDLVEAVLREAAKFSEEVLTPLNRVGDTEGCTRHPDGSVTTPAGFKDAFKQLVDGGWIGISAPA